MLIKYGTIHHNIDVTNICLLKLKKNDIITIPSGDSNRANIFTDPLFGTLKIILISFDDGILHNYSQDYTIQINITNNTISLTSDTYINNKLSNIHSKLNIKHGSLNDEFPEQIMTVTYLTGNEKVLEIGGNIGRNSLIIASIVEQQNFVSLECDNNTAIQLTENRDLNNFHFHIESSALSNKKLIQRGWDTIPSDILLDGYKWVNTITLTELKSKYNIQFDTLVLDCEGAFYYILMDIPEILNNIHLIIMENDYWDITHKQYVDNVLTKNGFYRNYVKSGGWGPCQSNFFEVWKK